MKIEPRIELWSWQLPNLNFKSFQVFGKIFIFPMKLFFTKKKSVYVGANPPTSKCYQKPMIAKKLFPRQLFHYLSHSVLIGGILLESSRTGHPESCLFNYFKRKAVAPTRDQCMNGFFVDFFRGLLDLADKRICLAKNWDRWR